jgi:phenylalanyl-tRNA synthetase beta chain
VRLLSSWLREFVNIPVDDSKLANDLTMAGISVEGVINDGGETVYDIDITPNRVDAMNHYGVARDCGAVYNSDLKPAAIDLPRPENKTGFTVEIQAADLCARFTGRIITGVTIKDSPKPIADRLKLLEQRPISNAADATNYVMWAYGHPTHAFDLDLLEGNKIIVRRAHEGEVIKTLDGVERKLTKDDLVIADAKKAVGIAGVMGGYDTMITGKTKNVLIEAAWFDPAAIRRTSRRLGMHTDASHRFERGADWGFAAVANDHVAKVILDTAGGTLGPLVDQVARKVERPTVSLRCSEVKRILGQEIEAGEIERILRHLGFGVTAGRSTTTVAVAKGPTAGVGGTHAAVAEEPADFAVQVPTWRLDVDREIDLIEEVARIYGFDKFPNTLPSFSGAVQELPDERKENRLRRDLLALGYNQAISLSFISHEEAKAFAGAGLNSEAIVEVANPLSEEASVMRTSLVPSMLDMLARNLNYGTSDVKLFEFGDAYEKVGDKAEQYRRLSIGASGNAVSGDVHENPRPYTFFDMKGDIETMLAAFRCNNLYFDASAADYYHPGRSARVVMDGRKVAQFGQIHPKIAAQRKLKQDVFVAEFDLERLYQQPVKEVEYKKIANYPAVDRDFSFIFGDEVTFERIRTAVDALRLSELRHFWPVEVFRGGSVPAGKYSVLLRAEFQSAERTYRDEEIQVWAAQMVAALKALGGTQRA